MRLAIVMQGLVILSVIEIIQGWLIKTHNL